MYVADDKHAQAIKLYAWEEPYKKRVVEFREAELKQVETMTWLQGILSINSAVAAVIVPVVMFGIYTAQGRLLTPAVAFPALFIVQLIRFPLAIFPAQLGLFVTAEVSGSPCWWFRRLLSLHALLNRPPSPLPPRARLLTGVGEAPPGVP